MDKPKRLTEDGPSSEDQQLSSAIRPFIDENNMQVNTNAHLKNIHIHQRWEDSNRNWVSHCHPVAPKT